MGKVKSDARKPPAKPKQRRKRQIDAEHDTGSPSGIDTRHAFLTAISTRGCELKFAAYQRRKWLDCRRHLRFDLRTDVRLSTIRLVVLEFLCCRGSYFYPACPDTFRHGWVGKKIFNACCTKNPCRSPLVSLSS